MEEKNIFKREGVKQRQISTTTATSKTNIPTRSDPHPHQLPQISRLSRIYPSSGVSNLIEQIAIIRFIRG
jgi:hypothetical protein